MHRTIWLSLTALALANIALVATGQTSGEVATDPADDAKSGSQVIPFAPAVADLLSLAIQDSSQELVFTITTSTSGPALTPAESVTYVIEFSYRTQQYVIISDLVQSISNATSGPSLDGHLMKLSPQSGQFEAVQELNTSYTPGVAVHHVPSELIIDQVGLPLFQGQYLDGILARTYSGFEPSPTYPPQGPGVLVYDQMPDQSTAAYQIQAGVETDLPFVIKTENPVRASNGGTGTFVFPIEVFNTLSKSGLVRFSILDPPAQWTVGLIEEVVQVPAQAAVMTGLVIQTPFGHAHGEVGRVNVQATDVESGKSATLEFQIVYASPPQPAGHHSTVFIHSANRPTLPVNQALETIGEYQSDLYMNTLPEDEADDRVPVNHKARGTQLGWWIPLKPDLAMGLRTDSNGRGQLEFQVEPSMDVDFKDVRISGELRVVAGETIQTVATLSEWTTPTISATTSVTLDVIPTQQSSFDFQAGQILELFVSLQATPPVPGAADIFLNWLPGAQIQVPLLEYGDPIPPTALASVVDAPLQVLLNVSPGKLFIAEVPVTNTGSLSLKVAIEPIAARPEWELLLQPTELQLAAGNSGTVKVSGIAPADSVVGDRLQIPLVLRHDAPAGKPVVVGLVLNFVQDAPIYEQTSKEASAIGPLELFGALLLLAVTRRRA